MKTVAKVCIVGAGPSGLAALKAFNERGIGADCYEQSDRLGGLWALQNSLGKTSAYRSLHINTSAVRSQFSDFPMPAHYPDYPHHAQMAAYFAAYAEHFGLTERIQFNTEVTHIERLSDGRFEVQLGNGERAHYTAVAVANGHHSDPHWPKPPPGGGFSGAQIHATDYFDPDHPLALRGRRVVVVGMGNSAMDIASELAFSGARVTLSARRGAFVLPKWIAGKPVDQTSVLPKWVPGKLRRRINQQLLQLLVGKMQDYGLPEPDHRLGGAHPTLSSDLLSLIRAGRITPKPTIAEFSERRIRFVDESVQTADAIVFCTGYNVRFPFFSANFLSAPDNDLPLFFRVHKPGIANLFFVGLCQPVGAIMPIVEAQANWIASQVAGEYVLPHPHGMRRQIAAEAQSQRARYVPSRRHTMQVDLEIYLQQLTLERARGRVRSRTHSSREASSDF